MRPTGVLLCLSLAVGLALIPIQQGLAQSSPSVFSNPSIALGEIRRVALLGFTADPRVVQDPFAAQKAEVLLSSAFRAQGLQVIEFSELVRRVQSSLGRNLTQSSSDFEAFMAEVPNQVDAAFIGIVSAWGTVTREGTSVLPIPVHGWGSAWSWGPGGGRSISGSWQTTQYVPIRRSYDVSVVGATVALVRTEQGKATLAWQYSHVRTDRGGPFIWQRPPPPDQLAEKYFQDLAKAVPLRNTVSSPVPAQVQPRPTPGQAPGSAPSPTPMPRPDGTTTSAAGNWQGVWGSSLVNQGGPFFLSLAQIGSSLTGTAVLEGSPCFVNFQATGELTGNEMILRLIHSGVTRAEVRGFIHQNSISVTYTVLNTGTNCDGDRGTATAMRR